MTSSRLEIY